MFDKDGEAIFYLKQKFPGNQNYRKVFYRASNSKIICKRKSASIEDVCKSFLETDRPKIINN